MQISAFHQSNEIKELELLDEIPLIVFHCLTHEASDHALQDGSSQTFWYVKEEY